MEQEAPAPVMLLLESSLHGLGLELSGDHVGLDDRDAIGLVDLEDAVHTPHVELEGVVLVTLRGGKVIPAGRQGFHLMPTVLVGSQASVWTSSVEPGSAAAAGEA